MIKNYNANKLTMDLGAIYKAMSESNHSPFAKYISNSPEVYDLSVDFLAQLLSKLERCCTTEFFDGAAPYYLASCAATKQTA